VVLKDQVYITTERMYEKLRSIEEETKNKAILSSRKRKTNALEANKMNINITENIQEDN
jgi:hypothetical protein